MSVAEAETLKCQVGLIRGEGPESAEVVAEAIRPLVNEIRSSLNYFTSGNPNAPVSRLALVGGAALLPGLTDRLTESLGVPTFLSDPLQRVTIRGAAAGTTSSADSGHRPRCPSASRWELPDVHDHPA